MSNCIETLSHHDHPFARGLTFRELSEYELQPVDRFDDNNHNVGVDQAERVIRLVCQGCPVLTQCSPKYGRTRGLLGLIAGSMPEHLRIRGMRISSAQCCLNHHTIPDREFRRPGVLAALG